MFEDGVVGRTVSYVYAFWAFGMGSDVYLSCCMIGIRLLEQKRFRAATLALYHGGVVLSQSGRCHVLFLFVSLHIVSYTSLVQGPVYHEAYLHSYQNRKSHN